MALLTVEDLRTWFHTREGVVRAVDGISYTIDPGQILGIVGESGCGKSVSCYSLLKLIPMPPGRIESGTATFDGHNLLETSERDMRTIRGRRISMIFQDPMTALNPYMTIGDQLIEPLRVHEGVSKSQARKRATAMLDAVGIQDASRRMREYPHQFSGGMRQRVMIAMALITRPQLLIADEPTTALDVTVQAQILDLVKQMQSELGMAVILVTHDLGVVAGTCDEVLVMYAGRIVESAWVDDLFARPRHPYTKALIGSLPAAHLRGGDLYTIPGIPPDLSAEIVGCPFAPRCEFTEDFCKRTPIELELAPGDRAEVSAPHRTACLRVQRREIEL